MRFQTDFIFQYGFKTYESAVLEPVLSHTDVKINYVDIDRDLYKISLKLAEYKRI